MSRETEKEILIQQLNNMGIFETPQNRSLNSLTYHALLVMVATEKAVRS